MEIIKPPLGKGEQSPSSGLVISSSGQPAPVNALSYVQTRVVPLRAEHLERHRIVAYNKNSNMGWAFDLLRTQVLKAMEENGWRTLAITSPTPEAGKSVLAINLAMSIAHHTTKTALLVDFDLRCPKVGNYLGLPMEKSLNELLTNEAELQEVLVNPTLPRFVVLPTREPVPLSTEVLSSAAVGELIMDLRDRYSSRVVIFDLPPVLSSDDVITILPKFDCVLLVVANGMNTKKEIEESLHHLGRANLIGTVLNKSGPAKRPY